MTQKSVYIIRKNLIDGVLVYPLILFICGDFNESCTLTTLQNITTNK
jgi:hypothetical protein